MVNIFAQVDRTGRSPSHVDASEIQPAKAHPPTLGKPRHLDVNDKNKCFPTKNGLSPTEMIQRSKEYNQERIRRVDSNIQFKSTKNYRKGDLT